MKVVVARDELLKLLSKIQGTVPTKPSVPIIANILVEAIDDQLILGATDLMVSIRAFTTAKVLEEGSIVLPARRFSQLIRELTAPQVEIHVEQGEITLINSGSSHFKMQGLNKEEFPALPQQAEGVRLTLPAKFLKEMLSRTSFAAARDDSRPALNGICLDYTSNEVFFIGTDGKRLARLRASVQSDPSSQGSVILPIKAVDEITKLIDEKDASAQLIIQNDQISFEMGSATLTAKFIVGKYPDISRIIPKKSERTVLLHREELISLLRQVALFVSDTSNSVRFKFTTGELQLFATSSEVGEGRVSMPVNFSGPELEIAFNPHYFLDILHHSTDETVHLNLLDSFNPGIITDSTDALFLIMPMRIDPT